MEEKPKKGFLGSILDGFKTDEYKEILEKEEMENENYSTSNNKETVVSNNVAKVSQVDSATYSTPTQSSKQSVEEACRKLYAYLDTIDQPGIDFLEILKAANKMGGLTLENLQNAYKTFSIMDAHISPASLVESGEYYIRQIEETANSGIKAKENDRVNLTSQKNDEKSSLTNDLDDLTRKIQELTTERDGKRRQLESIDMKYAPLIQELEGKIATGNDSLKIVKSQLNSVISLVKQIKS